jgi:multiple sugar transport system substrate-binding protein
VRNAVTYNGEVYAIPIDVHGALWHINLDLWEQAGLVDENGAPMIPAGPEEFAAACQKVLETTDQPIIGSGDDDILGTAWLWASVLAQGGGSTVDENGMPNVNTPEALEALNTILGLRGDGCIGTGEQGAAREAFINGELAGYIGGTWDVNEFDAQVANPDAALKRYYVAPLPQIGEEPAGHGGSHTFVVPLGANADPDRVKAALSYLKYFWDHNLDWTRTGHATVRQSVADSPEYQALPHHSEYLGFGENAVYNPSTTWSVGYDDITREEITAALLGQKTPEQALADAQARLNDVAMFS